MVDNQPNSRIHSRNRHHQTSAGSMFDDRKILMPQMRRPVASMMMPPQAEKSASMAGGQRHQLVSAEIERAWISTCGEWRSPDDNKTRVRWRKINAVNKIEGPTWPAGC